MASDKLAYFFEAHDLVHVFADWPEEIGLVLCLDAAGMCELLLYHVSERDRMPAKAAEVLDCSRSALEIVPEVVGYPTRRVMFTDEQKLMSLILDEEDLPELAQDYLINHRFEASRQKIAPSPRPEAKAPGLAEVFRWKPRLHLSEAQPKPAPKPGLPEGFAALDASTECDFAEGVIEVGRSGVRLSLAPDELTIQTPVRRTRQIGVRDDFSCFVLPRPLMANWIPGDALVIDIPEDRFPRALRDRYSKGPRYAEVAVTRQGVFVTPGALLPPKPDVVETPKRRRRLFSPVRSALVGMVFLGLAAGAMLREDLSISLPFLPIQSGTLADPDQPSTRLASR